MIENKLPLTSLVAGSEMGVEKGAGTKSTSRNSATKKSGSKNRRKSRELVLKAVYRGMLNQSEMSQILRDMIDDPDYNKADEPYFKQLLEGVTLHLDAIDAKLVNFIDRPIAELSPVEHAILRIAGCELMFDLSIPYRVVINEGVELAKLFGGTDGHKYINGVLDKFAADVREAEVVRARS
jgi:transcription antitermination protein NusB